MSWTDPKWEAFCALLEEAWPGEFDDAARQTWRVLLDPLEPPVAIDGVRRLLLEGHRFRPSVSEILAAARRDPSQPTFDEAYLLIFGPGGILAARPPGDGPLRYATERDRQRLVNDAAIDRAGNVHPLVQAFVARQGLDRLRALGVNDPAWGEKRRADLEHAWDEHVATFDGRQVAAIASGGRHDLHQLDPLAVLGLHHDARPALEAGS